MLIESVAVYGSFELLYLAICTVGDFLPTVLSYYQSLEQNVKQAVLLIILFVGLPIITFLIKKIVDLKKWLDDKL